MMLKAMPIIDTAKTLPLLLSACLAVLVVGTGPAPAAVAEGDAAPGAEAIPGAETKPDGPPPEELKTLEQIKAAYGGGDYDKTIELAKDFVRNAKSGPLKTQAARLVAQSQRKKKQWDLAQGAYLSLRNHYEKGSDVYVRAEAVAEVLRASRDGVYHPLVQANGGQPVGTLDDDAVLERALACLVKSRARRLELRLPRLKRARTAEEVIQRFVPMAEEISHLRSIWPEMSPHLDRAAVQTAALRLGPLSQAMLAALKEKDAYYKARRQERGLNTARRQEMTKYKVACESLAAVENAFLETMDKLAGTRDWPEGQTLRQKAEERREAYSKLAVALTPPERSRRTGDGADRGRRGTGDTRW